MIRQDTRISERQADAKYTLSNTRGEGGGSLRQVAGPEAEDLIRSNRRGSGWDTLEIAGFDPATTLPPGAGASRRQTGSAYESASTMVVDRAVLMSYIENERARVATPVRTADFEPNAAMPDFRPSRLAPAMGVLFVLAGLLAVGWLLGRDWPSDLSSSVRALTSVQLPEASAPAQPEKLAEALPQGY